MRIRILMAAVALSIAVAIAVPALALDFGEAETFLALEDGEHPEGITFDQDGNLYFGNRQFGVVDGVPVLDSALFKIVPGGEPVEIADFEPSPLPKNGILGLVTSGDGDVYAAVDGGPDHGVWKISGSGKHVERIDGSQALSFPNALTFDARGNLYVTDSGPVTAPEGGSIWRLEKGATTLKQWTTNAALAPIEDDPFGFPAPGANGIAFYPPKTLYVANTERGQLFRISIRSNGSAGKPQAVTGPQALLSVDGIAVDVKGHVHCVLPGSLPSRVLPFPEVPPLVRVDPETGKITRTTLIDHDEIFDLGLSLAFDTLPGERSTLYVTAGDLDAFNPEIPLVGEGPAIIRAEVGVKGFRGK
jgi:sugar lactone lactonase YvrE